MNAHLAAIIESDRRLERLARANTLAGVPLPQGGNSFASAALAAGHYRALLVLEGYAEGARVDYLIAKSLTAERRVRGNPPIARAVDPQLLPWVSCDA